MSKEINEITLNVNAISKNAYKGANQDSLETFRQQKSFYCREWVTYVQAKDIGRQIQKGEKGVTLVRMIEKYDRKAKEKKLVPIHFTVFNILQTKEVENV